MALLVSLIVLVSNKPKALNGYVRQRQQRNQPQIIKTFPKVFKTQMLTVSPAVPVAAGESWLDVHKTDRLGWR